MKDNKIEDQDTVIKLQVQLIHKSQKVGGNSINGVNCQITTSVQLFIPSEVALMHWNHLKELQPLPRL